MVAQVPQDDIRETIVRFVETSAQPVLFEPGEESVELKQENFVVECRNGALVLQAWDQRRNIVRRVTAIESQTRAKRRGRDRRSGFFRHRRTAWRPDEDHCAKASSGE